MNGQKGYSLYSGFVNFEIVTPKDGPVDKLLERGRIQHASGFTAPARCVSQSIYLFRDGCSVNRNKQLQPTLCKK